MTQNSQEKLKIIIIGAGAISQEWHIPILLGRDDFEVVGIVDKSEKTQSLLQNAYSGLNVYSDISAISVSSFDAAIIATPVAFHYEIADHLLNQGKHVLVEKPIALNSQQAAGLVATAKRNDLVLGVSLYRRLYPSLGVLKTLIESNVWGDVKEFIFNWGDFYSWSASSLGNMTKELAGGGVLMDLGPHALDWLCELFGHDVELLDYIDDAVTGIETDCALQLRFAKDNSYISGKLSLSRIRQLGGELRIKCENASLILSVGERFSVNVIPHNADNIHSDTKLVYECSNSDQNKEQWFETFAREHDDFIDGIRGQKQLLSGESVLAAARIIDECYASKKQLSFDWNDTEHINIPELNGVKAIFITGASGFVGGRLIEILAERTNIKIYAGINNPNKATRLSRYNINMVQFDLNDLSGIDDILEQCDAIVHCAIGTSYGDDAAIYKTTVDGTANLISAAERCGVSKFLHMSSLAAIEMNSTESPYISEDNCIETLDSSIYSVSKLAAEKAVIEHSEQSSMQITILRPTTIYGPHSPLFMIGAGKQAISRGLCLTKEAAASPSNSIYIDNLIVCILLRLSSNETKFKNYFVNDDDQLTYLDFYGYFTEKFNKEISTISNKGNIHLNKESSKFLQLIAEVKQILASKELRKLALKVFNSKKLGLPARWLIKKFPSIESTLRDESGIVYRRLESPSSSAPIEASTSALVEMKKFKKEHPEYMALPREQALNFTESWLKFCITKES